LITTGYFTIANDGSGRKVTISACSCDTVLRNGDACVVALLETNSGPRYITTVTTQALVFGNKVNIGSWSITINQPTA
jgi:hypothetical protein